MSFLLISYLFCSNGIFSESLPQFEMKDQYGQIYSTHSLKSKPVVLLGCYIRDLEICRKIGRKIYWKMQNLLWKDVSKVNFLMYLDLRETNQMVEKYIEDSKTKEFESILLDRKGELSFGLKKKEGYLRVFNKIGIEIHSEYLETIENDKITKLHHLLKKEI